MKQTQQTQLTNLENLRHFKFYSMEKKDLKWIPGWVESKGFEIKEIRLIPKGRGVL